MEPTTTNQNGVQLVNKQNQTDLDFEDESGYIPTYLDNGVLTVVIPYYNVRTDDDPRGLLSDEISGSNSTDANDDDALGFDFSSVMNSLAGLSIDTGLSSDGGKSTEEKDNKQEHQDGEESATNHDESNDDVNVPLEELPIETKDNLPDVILENRQFDADEELMFEHRCKLYRFDTSDSEEESEWKERGVGNLTIVRRSVGTNYAYRILMRRDKVFKLCANHFIRGDMQLKAHGKNNNSFLWSTSADLSETEPTSETLAARFKTVEDAAKFKKAFEEAVDAINKANSLEHPDDPAAPADFY